MTDRGKEGNEENKRAALDYFLDDHDVDGKVADLYQRMVEPSDDTPELVKKLGENKKKLKLKLKKTSAKIKIGTSNASKKLAAIGISQKQTNPEADEIMGRLLAPTKKYEPPKMGATRINITEGLIPGVPLLPVVNVKKQRTKVHFKKMQLTLPKLPNITWLKKLHNSAWAHAKTIFSKKYRRYSFAGIGFFLVLIFALHTIQKTRQNIAYKNNKPAVNETAKKSSSGAQVAGDTVTKPDFVTLVPSATSSSIKDQIRFDAAKKVATYEDSINGTHVVISQQQVTSAQTNDPTFLSKLAANLYLKTQIDTNQGIAYMGINVDKHIQTVAFLKGNLLAFIQSENTLDSNTWAGYINGLELQ